MKLYRVYGLTCVLTIVAAAASATTIVLPTDEQLVAKSPVIVEATVVSSTPVDRGTAIWTETRLTINRTLKGDVSGEVIVREIGGQIDNRITRIFGAPEYAVGEHVLVFLTPTPRGDYQTVDLLVGKFTEDRALNGRRLWKRDTSLANVSLLDSGLQPIESKNVQRDGEGFETYVQDRVAGRKGTTSYGIETPLLESDIPMPGGTPRLPIAANFTLISEPTVYRWFAFDRGSAARWYSYGTQPGYSGGGVNEVQTAMSGWNSVPNAKINYSYAGAGSGTPGGLSAPNGVNEVLFNDPKGEIAGSWNPSTGGVVGQGGFNGVTSGGSWTSTFTADSQHTQGTFHAYEITEGNLTIQDNVSSSTGISSARLAEIIAHEFGHTLGLGHSTDSTALMYPTVTGLGPTPRSDDQLAVQWLYPSGSAPPPTGTSVPAAPSNLSGSASGSNINLQWSDNSTNESGFYIYVSFNGGTFGRVTGSFGASQTSGGLTQATAGSYRIYLTAFNSAGESAGSNTITVTVSGTTSALSARFSVSPASGVAGQTVFSFTDQSTGNIVSRTWNFGDGFVSTATNVTHTYAAAGQYIVYLVISDGATQSQYSAAVTVAAPSPGVQAAFDVTPAIPLAGNAAVFNDRSAGSPTSWSWSFGDATASNQQNPTHTYTASGTYTVTLSVSNGLTSSTISHSIAVAQNDQLILNNSRYRVTIQARDQRTGLTAVGLANAQTSEFGYFSLPEFTGDPNNPEVFVKVLGPVNNVPWVFFGGLTDVEYTLNVTDMQSGVVRTYHKDAGSAKGGYDTGSGQLPAGNCVANTIADSHTGATRATATSSQLALMNNRFGLTLSARDPRSGQTASGITIPKNDESGFYTLPGLTGDASNIEVFVKIVNATSVDGHYWVFFGGLTDFEYTLTVADTGTGKVRSYTKPAGSACGGFDTTGF